MIDINNTELFDYFRDKFTNFIIINFRIIFHIITYC